MCFTFKQAFNPQRPKNYLLFRFSSYLYNICIICYDFQVQLTLYVKHSVITTNGIIAEICVKIILCHSYDFQGNCVVLLCYGCSRSINDLFMVVLTIKSSEVWSLFQSAVHYSILTYHWDEQIVFCQPLCTFCNERINKVLINISCPKAMVEFPI